MEFKIERLWRDEYEILYRRSKVDLREGVTILVGCNGAGKTSFIEQISQKVKSMQREGVVYDESDIFRKKVRDDVKLIDFNDRHQGGTHEVEGLVYRGMFGEAANMMMASEGERIYQSIGRLASRCGQAVRTCPKDGNVFILFDAVDSGLSIDNIDELKHGLFDLIVEDAKSRGVHIYIIASANEYELTTGYNCLDIVNLTYKTFKTYDQYRKFVFKTREYKDKRIAKGIEAMKKDEEDRKKTFDICRDK